MYADKKAREIQTLVSNMAKSLVDYPEGISLTYDSIGDNIVEIRISCHQEDIRRLLGREGRNINAMRTVLHGCARKHDLRSYLYVNENNIQ